MAGRNCAVVSSDINTTTSRRCILTYTAPSGAGVKVKRASMSFNGTSPTGPKVKVEVVKGVSGGTAVQVVPAGQKGRVDGTSGSMAGTASEDYSSNPTGGTQIFAEQVHPQAGYTSPEEFYLDPSETVALFATCATAVTANARFKLEE